VPLVCLIVALADSHGNINTFEHLVDYVIEHEDSSSVVLHAGDIFDDGYNNGDSVAQIIRLKENFRDLIVARGNHDPVDVFDEYFEHLPLIRDVCENVSVIAIDSNRQMLRQVDFIKNEIQRRPDRHYVILLHHHLVSCSDGSTSPTFWKVALTNVLRENDLIVHGHSHVSAEYRLENGTLVLCSSKANKKRYECNDNCTICDDDSSLEYLRTRFDNDIWSHERIKI